MRGSLTWSPWGPWITYLTPLVLSPALALPFLSDLDSSPTQAEPEPPNLLTALLHPQHRLSSATCHLPPCQPALLLVCPTSTSAQLPDPVGTANPQLWDSPFLSLSSELPFWQWVRGSPGDPGRATPTVIWPMSSLNASRQRTSGWTWWVNGSCKQRPIPSSRLDELHRFGEYQARCSQWLSPLLAIITCNVFCLETHCLIQNPVSGRTENVSASLGQAAQAQPVYLPLTGSAPQLMCDLSGF